MNAPPGSLLARVLDRLRERELERLEERQHVCRPPWAYNWTSDGLMDLAEYCGLDRLAPITDADWWRSVDPAKVYQFEERHLSHAKGQSYDLPPSDREGLARRLKQHDRRWGHRSDYKPEDAPRNLVAVGFHLRVLASPKRRLRAVPPQSGGPIGPERCAS